MKKVQLLACLVMIATAATAQKWQDPLLYGKEENRLKAGKVFMFPTGCGNPATLVAADSLENAAAYYFDSCAHRAWIYDPKLKAWDSLHLGVAGSGSSLTFTSPLNESSGIVDLGGLSGYGSSGQLVRSTGTGWEYFTPTYVSPGSNSFIQNQFASAQSADYWTTGKRKLENSGATIVELLDGNSGLSMPYSVTHTENGIENFKHRMMMMRTATIDYNPGIYLEAAENSSGAYVHRLSVQGEGVKLETNETDPASIFYGEHASGYLTRRTAAQFKSDLGIVGIADSAWSKFGNPGTDPSTHFLGPSDSVAMRYKIFGRNVGWISPGGFNSGGGISYTNQFTTYGMLAGNNLINEILAGTEDGGLNLLIGPGSGMNIGADYDTTGTTSRENLVVSNLGAMPYVTKRNHTTTSGRNTVIAYSGCHSCLTPGENTLVGAFVMENGYRPIKNAVVGASALRAGNDASYMSVLGAYAAHYTGCSIASATITNGGSGYTTATVTFSAPLNWGSPGSCYATATGTAVISGGAIVDIIMTDYGCGYSTTTGTYPNGGQTVKPYITITGDGTGATADAVVQCGDNTISIGHAAGWMNRAPKNMIFMGAIGSTRWFDEYGGLFGSGADVDASVATTTKMSNFWAMGKNAKVAVNNAFIIGGPAGGADTLRVGIGTGTPTATLDLRGRQVIRPSVNLYLNEWQGAAGNTKALMDSLGSLKFYHLNGLEKVGINNGGGVASGGYITLNHRFGQGENNYKGTMINATINEDSASKKARGYTFVSTHNMAWTDPVTINPSSIDGGEYYAMRDLAPRKGDYSFFTSTGFPTSAYYGAQRFRTESSTDSVAKFTFYGGSSAVESAPSTFYSLITANHGKQIDLYGAVNGFMSSFNGSTQAGRYFQQLNHFAVRYTGSMTAGRTGSINGLYIENLKTDSVDRAWGVIQLGLNDRNAFRGKVMIGDTTHAAADSAFTVKGNNGARFERGMNAPNLPVGKQALQLYVDANGTFYVGDSTGTGGGSGSGTVNTGAPNKAAYYPGAGTTVDDVTGAEFNGTNKIFDLTAQAATDVVFTINAHASQSARLMNVKSSGGSDLFYITSNGTGNYLGYRPAIGEYGSVSGTDIAWGSVDGLNTYNVLGFSSSYGVKYRNNGGTIKYQYDDNTTGDANIRLDGYMTLKEIAAPSTPATGYSRIYVKTDGLWYGKDDAGTETMLSNSGSAGLGDPGGNGIVVRTALNTTTNRTLTDGVGIGWTNGSGVSGNPVADIKGYNIWDNATTTTTSTSTATVGTITPDDNTRGTAVVTLVGIDVSDGTKGLTGKKFVHWKKISGTVTVLSVVDEQADYLETWTTTTWTVDASGGTLRIRVTPETTNGCDWSAQYAVKFVTYQF